ncbi:MAG: RluA family pseudouridine synthase [Candidatus Nealsonbacteria bacterium]
MKIIYEDSDLLVIDKLSGVNSDDFEKRVHRLDKDTSGVLLVAKNDEALKFFQKQFQEKKVKKQYIALVAGHLKLKTYTLETLISRSPNDRRKQKAFLNFGSGAEGTRTAKTIFRVLQSFADYDLIEAEPHTGRKHQIRAQLTYLGHPIAGDKLYGFKGQICPKGLKRQFLHSNFLKIQLPNGETKEFTSELPQDLKDIINNLKIDN